MSITFESSCPRELRAPIIHLGTEAREARRRGPLDITRESAQSPARYHWRGDVNLPWYRRGWLLGQETRPFPQRQRAVICLMWCAEYNAFWQEHQTPAAFSMTSPIL